MTALRFGISLGHGGASVVEGANAFAGALERRLAQPVKVKVDGDYDKLLASVLARSAEVAWMPPLLHVKAAEAGATLIAVSMRSGVVTYRSALLVRADSKYKSARDLAGARPAWTDPTSAAGHIFPRLHLEDEGVADKLASDRFVGSPMAACAAVSDGSADLCACFVSEAAAGSEARAMEDVKRVYAAAPWRLRVLAITDPIPPDGVVVAPGVEPALTGRITDAVLSFHERADGQEALRKLMYADRLVAVDARVSAMLARLRRVR